MSKYNYFSGHNHTDYSNLALIDSINKVEDLIDKAYEIGLKGIAITDHECLTAHYKAIKYYNKHYKDKDFTLALGNEIYLAREGLNSSTHQKGEKFYHCILIAKDKIGHEQLRRISSRAWDRGYVRALMRRPTYISDLVEIVGENPGHLIATTACLGSAPGVYFQRQELGFENQIDGYINIMEQLFGEDFYIELQPNEFDDQRNYNNFMINKYWGKIKFTVATDSHYLSREEFPLFLEYLNSKDDSGNREADYFYKSAFLMTPEEIAEFLEPDLGIEKVETLFKGSMDIASKIEDYSLDHDQVVPKIIYEWAKRDKKAFSKLKTITNKFDGLENLKGYLQTEEEADKYLAYLIAEGLFTFIDNEDLETNTLEYLSRLDNEIYHIDAISKAMGQSLSNYFVTMGKIMDIVWTGGDSIIGPGRGSGCGSLINYLCGITELNPLRQELEMPFWRFIDKSRPGLPDIDFDTESSKRSKIFNAVQKYFNDMGGDAINIATFGTLGTKSAIRTAARGIQLEDSITNYIVSMVPTERGKDWTIEECLSLKQFVAQMEKYPKLFKLIKRIEGLITNLSVHASGVVVVNGSITDLNSTMRTKGGVRVTAWDLYDSEAMGSLKYDFLTVQALDKIRTCMNLLLDDGTMAWQGNLKSTFEKYLLPSVLEYKDADMWKKAANGEVLELFQFDTPVGSRAIRLIQPTSIRDLTAGNSIMRLMADGEQPLEIFAKYKKDINLWYKEMSRYGLNEDEVAILEKYLLPVYGVAGSQELAMMLTMDPKISNFDIAQANALRKGIAKKVPEVIEKTRKMFFEMGQKVGTRENFLNYVWKVQIGRQLGYSFSDLHTMAYSTIALQELNLNHHYHPIYWNTACLSVNANAVSDEDFENLVDDGIIEIEDNDDKKKSGVSYDKIAVAIGKFKDTVKIETPDINKAKMGFTPNVTENSIMFGLKGISLIGDEIVQHIIDNRPFNSLKDFMNKMVDITNDGKVKKLIQRHKVISLIKAGCFDKLEKKPREEIMEDFFEILAPKKTNLNLNNFLMLIRSGLVPEELNGEVIVFLLTKEFRKNKDGKGYYDIDSEDDVLATRYTELTGKMPLILEGKKKISESEWTAIYERQMNKVRAWIKKDMDILIDKLVDFELDGLKSKYAKGNVLKWELDSINFYHSGHPLENVKIPFEVRNINDLKENEFDGEWVIDGQTVPKMKLSTIFGTVLVKDKQKRTIVLSTKDGIIKCKIYKTQFTKYDRTLKDDFGNIVQPGFFEKGTHLAITGIIRDEMFIPKTYKSTKIDPIIKVHLTEDDEYVGVEIKR